MRPLWSSRETANIFWYWVHELDAWPYTFRLLRNFIHSFKVVYVNSYSKLPYNIKTSLLKSRQCCNTQLQQRLFDLPSHTLHVHSSLDRTCETLHDKGGEEG